MKLKLFAKNENAVRTECADWRTAAAGDGAVEQLDCQTIGKSMVYFGAQSSFQFSCLVASYRLSHHKEWLAICADKLQLPQQTCCNLPQSYCKSAGSKLQLSLLLLLLLLFLDSRLAFIWWPFKASLARAATIADKSPKNIYAGSWTRAFTTRK